MSICDQYDVVSEVKRLLGGQSGARIREGTRRLSLLQDVQTNSGAHSASYLMGARFLSRG